MREACSVFVYKQSLHPELCGDCWQTESRHPQKIYAEMSFKLSDFGIGWSYDKSGNVLLVRLLFFTIKIYKSART